MIYHSTPLNERVPAVLKRHVLGTAGLEVIEPLYTKNIQLVEIFRIF